MLHNENKAKEYCPNLLRELRLPTLYLVAQEANDRN